MPWYEGTHGEQVGAPPDRCFALLTDYERMPEWQGPLERAEPLERDGSGLATLVDYEISTPVRSVSYRLRHGYEPPRRVTGELVEGQVRGFVGTWALEPAAGGTRVEFALRIDPGFWVPGRIARLLHETVMKRTVADLKRAAEGG